MKLKNSTYKVLKFIAMIVLPAAGTAYFAIAGLWHLPHTEQVIGTITAIDTLMGGLLHVSTKSYSPVTNGKFVVDKSTPGKRMYTLEVTTPLDQVENMEHILLKIEPAASIEMKTSIP